MPTTFVTETNVVPDPGETGRYHAHFGPDWFGPRAPQGGLVAATTLRAMTLALDHAAHRLRTSTTVFARTVHFLDRTEHDWMLQVLRMRRATHGYGSGEMELWSRDGQLLAQASQTMLFSTPR